MNIVLLGSDSSDSRLKSEAYGTAARRLGLETRDYPDRHTAAVIPTSDSRALDAAWMARHHGIPGPEPIAVAIASSKSLAYEFLCARGFALLPWMVPSDERDLEHDLGGRVIVKPDVGSGSTGTAPWSYRVFADLRDFRRYLSREGLMRRFIARQRYGSGRHLAMRYVEQSEIFAVQTVAGDGAPVLYDCHTVRPMPGSKVTGRILIGARHPRTGDALRMADALAKSGLRRSVIFLQCVSMRGRLYPIDLNLRPGSLWSRAAVRFGVPAFEELLMRLLGRKRAPRIRWPAPYVGVGRVPLRLRPGTFRVEHSGDAVSLVDMVRSRPRKYYDIGQAWPMLAVACQRPKEFDTRWPAAVAATRLVPTRRRRPG